MWNAKQGRDVKRNNLLMQATILDLVTANRSSLGNYADHATNHASTLAKVIVGFGAVVIVAFLNSLLGRRRRT